MLSVASYFLVGLSMQQDLYWTDHSIGRIHYVPHSPTTGQVDDGVALVRARNAPDDNPNDGYIFEVLPRSNYLRPYYQSLMRTTNRRPSRVKQQNSTVSTRPTLQEPVASQGFFRFLFRPRLMTSYVFIRSAATMTVTHYCTEPAAFKELSSCDVRRKRSPDPSRPIQQHQHIHVSPVERILKTALVDHHHHLVRNEPSSDILSSMIEPRTEQIHVYSWPSLGRSTSTLLSTVTTVPTVPDTITTTIVVSAKLFLGDAQMICIPPNIQVCPPINTNRI